MLEKKREEGTLLCLLLVVLLSSADVVRNSMGVPQNLKIKLQQAPAFPLQGTHKINTFIVALFITVNTWNQPKTGS